MALHKLLYGITLILILQFRGSNAQLSVCGKAPLNNHRIVGGQDASNGSWPWQASLHYFRHFCGGSLINKEYVLTAAHCLRGMSVHDVTVYLGRQSQELANPNEVNRTVTQFIVHPDYGLTPYDSDIALLKLSSPVTFTPYISPVCLAAANSTFYTGTTSWVTGWGTVNYTVPLPSPQNLQEVQLPMVGNNQCNCSYQKHHIEITENMICAGAAGIGGCHGDSGGPMVSLVHGTNTSDGHWVQSGVVNFGIPCGLPDFPTVYARVSRFQDWINSHINLTSDQPGFVTIDSTGTDIDEDFVCPTPPPFTTPPTTTPMFTTPPTPPTTPMLTTPSRPPKPPITTPAPPKPCESVFCGGPNVVHFSYFTLLLTLVFILYTI